MCVFQSYFNETIIKDKDVSTDQYLELVHSSFCEALGHRAMLLLPDSSYRKTSGSDHK